MHFLKTISTLLRHKYFSKSPTHVTRKLTRLSDVTVIGNGSGGGEDPEKAEATRSLGDLGIFFNTSAGGKS